MTLTRRLLAAGLLVLATGPAAAVDVQLGPYRAADTEGMRDLYAAYLDGVKAGLMSANAWLKVRGQQPVFCPPEILAITTDMVKDIMLGFAKRRAAKDEMLVSLLLMNGLRDTYPCGSASVRAEKPPSQASGGTDQR